MATSDRTCKDLQEWDTLMREGPSQQVLKQLAKIRDILNKADKDEYPAYTKEFESCQKAVKNTLKDLSTVLEEFQTFKDEPSTSNVPVQEQGIKRTKPTRKGEIDSGVSVWSEVSNVSRVYSTTSLQEEDDAGIRGEFSRGQSMHDDSTNFPRPVNNRFSTSDESTESTESDDSEKVYDVEGKQQSMLDVELVSMTKNEQPQRESTFDKEIPEDDKRFIEKQGDAPRQRKEKQGDAPRQRRTEGNEQHAGSKTTTANETTPDNETTPENDTTSVNVTTPGNETTPENGNTPDNETMSEIEVTPGSETSPGKGGNGDDEPEDGNNRQSAHL